MHRATLKSLLSRAATRRGLGLALLACVAGTLALGIDAGAAAGPAVPPPAPLPAPTIRSVSVVAADARVAADDGGTVAVDRVVTIEGGGFYGTSFGPFVHFVRADGQQVEASYVFLQGPGRLIASPPRGTHGSVTVVVENPDRARVSFVVGL